MLDSLLTRDVFPDFLLRFGIRQLLRQRLREEDRGGAGSRGKRRG